MSIRIWAPIALVAVLAALFLWSRYEDRASGPRATTRETEGAQSDRAARDAAEKQDSRASDTEADLQGRQRDYLAGGHVVDSSGHPVSKANVLLRQGSGDAFIGDNMETTTGEDGRFRFEGVLETPCEIRVGAEGFAPSGVDTYSGDVSVEVVLRRAASVEGLVVDGDGRPVAAMLLRLSDPRLMPGNDYDFDEVDDSGRFRLEGRNPGRLDLRAVTEDGREGEAQVEVKEGDEIRGLRIEVLPPWRSHVRVRALVAKGSRRDIWFAKEGKDPRVEWQGEVATLLFREPPGTSVPLCVTENGHYGDDCRSSDRVLETAPLDSPAVIDVLLSAEAHGDRTSGWRSITCPWPGVNVVPATLIPITLPVVEGPVSVIASAS
jgi:hypothetical protein